MDKLAIVTPNLGGGGVADGADGGKDGHGDGGGKEC